MLKIIFHSIYYQLLIFLRVKQAVFFTLVFPAFLFIIFGSIWGIDNPEYVFFLLSGVIGMTIASDGLFAIGPVVKEYYANGLIKYLRKLPFNILHHFIGLIISKIITLIFIVLVLCIASKIVFDYSVSIFNIANFIVGIFIGLFMFAFMGLAISFSGIKYGGGKGIINFFYFIVLFTSNAFYPAYAFNETVGIIGNTLPLNPILNLLRGEGFDITIVFWLIIPVFIFYYLFNKVQVKR